MGDALRLPKRHPAWRRREAQSGSRKKLTCSSVLARRKAMEKIRTTLTAEAEEFKCELGIR